MELSNGRMNIAAGIKIGRVAIQAVIDLIDIIVFLCTQVNIGMKLIAAALMTIYVANQVSIHH